MNDKGGKSILNKVISKHREDINRQNKIYRDHLSSQIRNVPVGAGLDSDDLSKVATVDAIGIGDPTDILKK